MIPRILLVAGAVCAICMAQRTEDCGNNRQKGSIIVRMWSFFIDMLSTSDGIDQEYYDLYSIDESNDIYSNSGNSSYVSDILVDRKLSWDGKVITSHEIEVLGQLKLRIHDYYERSYSNDWLKTAADLDLLKFIRTSRESDVMGALLNHNKWRNSIYGADRIKTHNYEKSILNQEAFWLGESKSGCPTLVVRSQLHDGADYNEDAKYFTGFLVWLLEEGRKKYGNKQVCVILDRSTIVFSGGYTKKEMFDLGILPKLVELFTTIYSTISTNYPDILHELKIFPTSWFFSACYRITSRIFDSHTRNKFKIIHAGDIFNDMRSTFASELIPSHLGGNNYKMINWGVVSRYIPGKNESVVVVSENIAVNPLMSFDSFI